MNETEHRSVRGNSRRQARRERIIAASAILALALLCAGWLLLPAALRLVPPRYVARLPEPLQALASRPHADFVPTPAFTAPPVLLTSRPTASRPAPAPTATVAPAHTATPTSPPSASPQPPSPAPTDTPTVQAATRRFEQCPPQIGRGRFADLSQATVLLDSPTLRYMCQTWNNCGPATLAMDLSFWGWDGTQAQAAAVLRPDPEDKHTGPDEIARYAQSQGYAAIARIGGTVQRLKALLEAGLPVIVSRGFMQEGEHEGWLSHYGLVIGYSEPLQEFVLMDSLDGPDQALAVDELDTFWSQFNYRYIVVYPPDREADVRAILGADLDDAAMYQAALARAQARTEVAPEDAFGWNNLGWNLLGLGDAAHAAAAFDRARQIGLPYRLLWYQFNMYEAYLAVGRYDDVIALADAVLQTTPYVEETYYYKGRALQAKGDNAGARALYRTALQHNPGFTAAADALAALP